MYVRKLLLVVASLNDGVYPGYTVRTERWRLPDGAWCELFNSDSSLYGGDNAGNLGASLPSADGDLDACAALYAGMTPRDDPLVSPALADYSADLPAALLVTGTRDLLLSDTVRLHQRMRAGGQRAELLVYEGMWHSFLYDDFPEARTAWAEVSSFLARELATG